LSSASSSVMVLAAQDEQGGGFRPRRCRVSSPAPASPVQPPPSDWISATAVVLPVGRQLHQRAARTQGRGLRGDDLGVRHLTRFVAVLHLRLHLRGRFGGLAAQGLLRISTRVAASWSSTFWNASQHRLAVSAHGLVVGRAGSV
jgi:hypothetical protein